MRRDTGHREMGYRIKPKATERGILVPEDWYDARVVWVSNAPRFWETSQLRDEPFKRYHLAFELVQEDGNRGKVFCSIPWPLDDVTFSRKSAVWVLGEVLMGEGYMEAVTDPASEVMLDTSQWLGKRAQIYPQMKTVGGTKQSRVSIDTFSGETHIRVAREVDPTSTRLLWEKVRQLRAPQEMMSSILREFSIPTPNPKNWLLVEQKLVNFRLQEWLERHQP